MIDHNLNGAFVRSSWEESPIEQTETVHALRVAFRDGKVQFWDARPQPFTDGEVQEAARVARRGGGLDVSRVSRAVTIRTSAWQPE